MDSEHVDPTEHLTALPQDPRDRELWMQHAIGYVLMRDVREYALSAVPVDAEPEVKRVAMRVLDKALFGLMEIVDSYNVPIRNGPHLFRVDLVGTVQARDDNTVIASQSLADGDGACMGVHSWLDGDFGDLPPVEQIQRFAPQSDWLAE
jgi:hypothetical protein